MPNQYVSIYKTVDEIWTSAYNVADVAFRLDAYL